VDYGDYERLRKAEPVKHFDRAVEVAPLLAVRWYLRGLFHRHAGRHREALRDLRKAVELAPDAHNFCHELAWLYAAGPEALRDAGRAVALAERAVELRPGEWGYHNTLGVAYYRAGRHGDSIAALTRSLEKGSHQHDAFDLYFLALCHHARGDAARARNCFARARAWHRQHAARLTQEDPGGAEELQRFRTEAEQALAPPPPQPGGGS
jgi:tetratricopeptide (TPR) repeat protein